MRSVFHNIWPAINNPGTLAVLGVAAQVRSFYITSYLAGLAAGPLLDRLAKRPATLDEITKILNEDDPASLDRDALQCWVSLGLSLRVLGQTRRGITLRSRLARRLARPESDAARAFLINLPRTHSPLLTDALDRIGMGTKYELEDLDSALIARSSLTVEFVIRALMHEIIPSVGPTRILEVGCGSGAYMSQAVERNPEVTVLGVDRSPQVVHAAQDRLRRQGLAERAEVRCGDIRSISIDGKFQIVTLHNLIYYFPVAERAAIYEQLRDYLSPGGVIVTNTWCQSRTPGAAAIGLWFSLIKGCGRLPTVNELQAQLADAGFRSVKTRRLLPFEEYFAFLATKS